MSNRKLLLAYVRKGNYAHAGEEEAIDLTMDLIVKNSNQTILDVGSGLGGTANYIKQKKWGTVWGIDSDPNMIRQASRFYPDIPFKLCDANHVDVLFGEQKFVLFCIFNAFFCFKTQENCLKAFSHIAKKGAELVIFDYSSPGHFSKANPFVDQTNTSTEAASFVPLNLTTIESTLHQAHWELRKIIHLNDKFIHWYQSLISKMEAQRKDLIERFGLITFNELHQSYVQLLAMMEKGEIGGCTVYATYIRS